MSKKISVVVDMQKDFIDGCLGSPEAIQIVDSVEAKIKAAASDGNVIIFTRDTHGEDYLDTEEGKNLPVPHCIKDTDGWQINDRLLAAAGSDPIIVNKETFGSRDLGQMIADILANDKDIEAVELFGLCTDICVISNALLVKAFNPNIPIYVDATCSAGVTPDSHDTALAAMDSCQINITGEGEEPWRKKAN